MATDNFWVLDTSVAVRWFVLGEPLADHANAVQRSVSTEPRRFVVPPLFYSELVHVLARVSGRNERFVGGALALITRIGLPTVTLRAEALQRSAHWACKGLSGYDATFVALAEDLGAKWLTADEPAAKIAGPSRAGLLRKWNADA